MPPKENGLALVHTAKNKAINSHFTLRLYKVLDDVEDITYIYVSTGAVGFPQC